MFRRDKAEELIKKYFSEEERKLAAKEYSARYYMKNRSEILAKNAEWSQRNKEYLKTKKHRRYFNGAVPTRIKQREQILNAYGRKCSECGVTDVRVLDLAHKNGNGAEHRKAVGAWKVYKDVIDQGFPKDFDLQCKNCNWLDWLRIKPPATTL